MRYSCGACGKADEVISILFGLCSALSWGVADFAGGLASRKTGAYRAVFFGETIGFSVFLPVALLAGEPKPDAYSLTSAALAGGLGTMGLLLLYHSLAIGTMSIAAPVSALMAAVLPVIVGSFSEGFPGLVTLIGFALALTAIWLISQSSHGTKDVLRHLTELRLPLLAGVGFGCFFILMHASATESTWWPIVIARSAGLLVTGLFMLSRGDRWMVPRRVWPILLVNGVLDVGANAFFILAGRAGRLDISAVLGSLYPGGTVLLAWIVLKERLSRTQWFGILAALIAIVLFTL
jgi:drug/metabolite transporter (DMT)-like permease